MKKTITFCLFFCLSISLMTFGQDTQEWTLEKAIQYAKDHSIQVKQLQLTTQSDQAAYEQAKASRWPSLNATAQQTYAGGSSIDPITSQYERQNIMANNVSLNANVNLFNGFQTTHAIQQQKLSLTASQLNVAEAQNSITIAVTQAYLQLLYDQEAVTNAEQIVTAGEAQLKRADALYQSGSSTEKDYAQVQAQYASDKYQLTTAQNQFAQQKLALQQLLEIPFTDKFEVYFPKLDADTMMMDLPGNQEVFDQAMAQRPEVKSSELSVDMAGLGIKIAKANLLPQLSLNGSLSSGYTSAMPYEFTQQFNDNFYQRVGLTLSIPIFNNKQATTAISQARINMENAQLNLLDTKKTLRQSIETAYLNAQSAQSRLTSAEDQLKATQSSYQLAEQQFNLGMLNAVDLLLEKNTFLSAQQEYLQAKYATILNYKLLDFYQGKPISI